MTNYARGAEFERRIKRHLETNGYAVIRSAGSHSLIDLIALKPGQTLLVQCKIHGHLGPADRTALTEFAAWLNIDPTHDYLPVMATKTKTGGHIEYRHVTNAHCRERWIIDYAGNRDNPDHAE